MERKNASAGHKLGQLVGDWFEEYFVLPLLRQVAERLALYLDFRFVDRPARRAGKLVWNDLDGNSVDYDFVLELGGTEKRLGVPVAFLESFWRRGARHSKDKARDDSGKLVPMRDTYPTARFLGIVCAGDFTAPARELVRSREIDLFYVPKDKVVHAFWDCGLEMDYPDRLSESKKASIARAFGKAFSGKEKRGEVAARLQELLGDATITSYVDRVRAKLSSLPQEIRIILRQDSDPIVFESVQEATRFLKRPKLIMQNPKDSFVYQVTYSDGSEFERIVDSIETLKALHGQTVVLTAHMNKISQGIRCSKHSDDSRKTKVSKHK